MSDAIGRHRDRQSIQRDRAIHRRRGSRRQQARVEQVALARGEECGTFVEIHVLPDDLPNPDHDVVGQRELRLAGLRFRRGELLEDAPGDADDVGRFGFDVVAKLAGHVRVERHGKQQHRPDGREHEEQEQLSVEAAANLVEQPAQGRLTAPGERRVDRRAHEHQHEQRRDDHGDFREPAEVLKHGGRRVAERVQPGAVVQEVHLVPLPAGREQRPERIARSVQRG